MPDPLYEDQVPPAAPGVAGNGTPEPHPAFVPAPPVDPALVEDQVPPAAPPVPGNDEPAPVEPEPAPAPVEPADGAQTDNG